MLISHPDALARAGMLLGMLRRSEEQPASAGPPAPRAQSDRSSGSGGTAGSSGANPAFGAARWRTG